MSLFQSWRRSLRVAGVTLAAALALSACSTTRTPVAAGGAAVKPVPVEAGTVPGGLAEARLRTALATCAAVIERDGAVLRVRIPVHSAFVMDQFGLLPQFTGALDELAHYLHGQKQLAVTVSVYTDAVGSEGYNLQFSQARAEAIASYLGAHGIAAQRVTAHGAGEAEPLAAGTSPEARELNRRVEFLISALSS